MLKEQEEIVKLWIKQQNQATKGSKNKLGFRNIKVSLSELLNQLDDLDSKYTNTKQTLLMLESYIKEDNGTNSKNALEQMVENLKEDQKDEKKNADDEVECKMENND